MSTIAFLGCGSMGEAVLAGVLTAGTSPGNTVATVRRPERAADLRERHGIEALATTEDPAANAEAARGASVLVLGVAPGEITRLAEEIGPVLAEDAVIVSLAAAVSIERLEAALPQGQPVVRTMPNTPVGIGRGVVSVSAGTHVSPAQLDAVRGVFEAVATVVDIDEAQIDALSAISGSGPAYVFYLAEAMRKAGIELGLNPELARMLANRTVAGAGAILAGAGAKDEEAAGSEGAGAGAGAGPSTRVDAGELLRGVASPNGTTQKAIDEFEESGVAEAITRGARAAAARAAEISAEL
ncbi:pyrroline-5-carboxylate reductase [Dietzia sp.]|uniref:pyrroline-5-carboxylate reductase n=1 Tax=Dietzia sp. TaxID=1871616 RepID=UPI002FD8F2BE